MSRRLATVIEVGNMVNAGRTVTVDPATDICQRNIKLLGMSANPPQSYSEAMALLGRADLPFASLISAELPLSDPRAALNALGGDAIKVVLVAED